MKHEYYVKDCDGQNLWLLLAIIMYRYLQILIRPCRIDGIFIQLDPEVLRPTTTMLKPERKHAVEEHGGGYGGRKQRENMGKEVRWDKEGLREEQFQSHFVIISHLLSDFTIFVNVGGSSASSFAH